MSGVKRYDISGFGDGMVEIDDGAWVHVDDHAALVAERDELRAQVEAMRALLSDARRYVDKAWPDGVHSYRANSVSGDLLSKIDAALQAKL